MPELFGLIVLLLVVVILTGAVGGSRMSVQKPWWWNRVDQETRRKIMFARTGDYMWIDGKKYVLERSGPETSNPRCLNPDEAPPKNKNEQLKEV